jgi:aryl-alcohol dehydrogenase-like predicted oxidoreductase
MHTRLFNNSGRSVSEIGLGCWQLGGGDWGDLPDDRAFDILQAAVDAGSNFWDTADVYGGGRSEELIGRFIKDRKPSIFVATKLGRHWEPGGDANYTEASFRAHTEASLRKLQLETVDLTQLHCIPTEQMERGDVFEWLRKLQSEGKIRHFGASVQSMDEALICLKQDGIASLQIIFNIFRQKPITTLFDQAQAKKVALVIRLPLASGLLSGKMTKDAHFPTNDHRNYNRDGQMFNVGETFAGLPFELGVDLADALKPLVPSGLTMAQMALRWILDFPAVTVIIPGASRPDQAASNAAASGVAPLSAELHAELSAFYESRVREHIRGPY